MDKVIEITLNEDLSFNLDLYIDGEKVSGRKHMIGKKNIKANQLTRYTKLLFELD